MDTPLFSCVTEYCAFILDVIYFDYLLPAFLLFLLQKTDKEHMTDPAICPYNDQHNSVKFA